MLALHSPARRVTYHPMTRRPSDDDLSPAQLELKRLGQALAAVRRRKNLTQEDMGERLHVSTQAYQRYEAGHRKLPEHKLQALAEAAGASLEDVMRERALLEQGDIIPFPPRPAEGGPLLNELAFLLGPGADRLRLDTDALSPWASIGELIIYDRARPPRRDHGCVVEDLDGKLSVFMFAGRDDETARLYTLAPDRREVTRPMAGLRGVYAVRLRGD